MRAAGVPVGQVEPLAFVSFRSFSYATLSFDQTSLTVRVVSMPSVADPRTLATPAGLARYEAQQPSELLRFTVRAQ